MLERERQQLLAGRVEMDDAYLGGKRRGGKRGRGARRKVPFIAAVETTERGQPHRMMKLCRVKGFRRDEVKRASKKNPAFLSIGGDGSVGMFFRGRGSRLPA